MPGGGARVTFRFFIPFCDADAWLGRCLDSVAAQTAADWTAHLYDDLSRDVSAEIARDRAARDPRVRLRRNTAKRWAPGNLLAFAQEGEPADSDIAVWLDGDDWLPDPQVLERVAAAYAERPPVLLTYGSFIRCKHDMLTAPFICTPPEDWSRLRQLPWTTTALKTHRMGLLRRVAQENYLDASGQVFRFAGDLATLFPMLEMAGPERSRRLADINYVYNRDNPRNTNKLYAEEERANEALIRSRTPYPRLSAEAAWRLAGVGELGSGGAVGED